MHVRRRPRHQRGRRRSWSVHPSRRHVHHRHRGLRYAAPTRVPPEKARTPQSAPVAAYRPIIRPHSKQLRFWGCPVLAFFARAGTMLPTQLSYLTVQANCLRLLRFPPFANCAKDGATAQGCDLELNQCAELCWRFPESARNFGLNSTSRRASISILLQDGMNSTAPTSMS